MSCFDEVTYFEGGIYTQFFDPPSSETRKSLYNDDSNLLLSFAGLFSFFQFLLSKSENGTRPLCKRGQRGRVVSASDSQSDGPGFESRSGHLLDLCSVVPSSNSRPRL